MELRFGSYRLMARERQLIGPLGVIDVDGRSVDVLRVLLQKPNALVLKDEIFSAVWPGMAVGENTLQVHISALRKALGPDLIETVHGRGYKYRGEEPEVVAREAAARKGISERPIIAVLPFKSADGEEEHRSFGESLIGELIERLARFSMLSVVPHPVVLAGAEDGDQGDRPGSDFLLLCEVRRFGARIRVAGKLQDMRTRVVVWAEHYDRSLEDGFQVLDELSGTMAGRISTRVEAYMVSRQVPGRALTSYDHLVKGIWHFRSQTPDGPAIAEQFFRKSRELNPVNAEAIRWLSIRMTCRWLFERKSEFLAEGLTLGRAAAELDPASATCHAAHGFARLWAEGVDFAAASFGKAYAMNPHDGYMLADVGLVHIYSGRIADGCAKLDRAEQLNAFPHDWHNHYRGIARFVEEGYGEAIPNLQCLPCGVFGLVYLMACYGHTNNHAGAQSLMPRIRELGCDLIEAAGDEPFLDRGINARLEAGVRAGLALASQA